MNLKFDIDIENYCLEVARNIVDVPYGALPETIRDNLRELAKAIIQQIREENAQPIQDPQPQSFEAQIAYIEALNASKTQQEYHERILPHIFKKTPPKPPQIQEP